MLSWEVWKFVAESFALSSGIYGAACVLWDAKELVRKTVYSVY